MRWILLSIVEQTSSLAEKEVVWARQKSVMEHQTAHMRQRDSPQMSTIVVSCCWTFMLLFRWFKFTLKSPYSITMTNYDWPFGTLPFGIFWSNWDTRDLETYPGTYSGHFWNMSIFDNSRAIWVLFRKWVVSENQSFLDEGVIVTHLSV